MCTVIIARLFLLYIVSSVCVLGKGYFLSYYYLINLLSFSIPFVFSIFINFFQSWDLPKGILNTTTAVSYTHLDVYKRQAHNI